MRKFTAVPGKGIYAGSKLANTQRIMAAWYEYDGEMFNEGQMDEINRGLESGIDVSVYAEPGYDWRQMQEIRKGLESGVDVSVYADSKFAAQQMQLIRNGLAEKLDVDQYAYPEYSQEQMYEIYQSLRNHTPRESSRLRKKSKQPALSTWDIYNWLNEQGSGAPDVFESFGIEWDEDAYEDDPDNYMEQISVNQLLEYLMNSGLADEFVNDNNLSYAEVFADFLQD